MLWFPRSDSHLRTPSVSRSGQAGNLASQASEPSTLGCPRQSRSTSRAPGLADQICQILRLELWRGRDCRRRSSSSSGGSSVYPSSSQSESSPAEVRSQANVLHPAVLADVTLIAITPSVGVIAPVPICAFLGVVRVAEIAAFLVEYRISSVSAPSLVRRVLSRWLLRRSLRLSRPLHSRLRSSCSFLSRRSLGLSRLCLKRRLGSSSRCLRPLGDKCNGHVRKAQQPVTGPRGPQEDEETPPHGQGSRSSKQWGGGS